MDQKLKQYIFPGISLMIVICLFTIIDHAIHGLENSWSVPDFYFKDKIPFGFLWGAVGLFFARKPKNIWLKAMIVAGIIATTLQTRYFIEGYPLGFVLLFLLFHFIILCPLLLGMFFTLNKCKAIGDAKKIIIALSLLAITSLGTYYLVFNGYKQAPGTYDHTPTNKL